MRTFCAQSVIPCDSVHLPVETGKYTRIVGLVLLLFLPSSAMAAPRRCLVSYPRGLSRTASPETARSGSTPIQGDFQKTSTPRPTEPTPIAHRRAKDSTPEDRPIAASAKSVPAPEIIPAPTEVKKISEEPDRLRSLTADLRKLERTLDQTGARHAELIQRQGKEIAELKARHAELRAPIDALYAEAREALLNAREAVRRLEAEANRAVPDATQVMVVRIQKNRIVPNRIDREDEGWDEEEDDWGEEDEDTGRSFFYKELVISGFYSVDGKTGLPPDDPDEDHWEFSPRPPGSYIGFEYIRTFTPFSPINKGLPQWLQLTAIDLHPRFVFDRMTMEDGVDAVDFAPQDFWVRFKVNNNDRLSLRIGQFVLPYGVNPPLAPRQKFILPVEAIDLGLKWDWGIALKGPLGEFDWEIAATIGSGEGLHSTHLFRSSRRTAYLLTGRIGTPTYWDFQYGLSFLVGDLPTIRAANVMNENAISRWRVGLDLFYKYGTYLMMGGQVTYGQDGYAGDEEYVMLTGGETADVLAYRVWADWVVPSNNNLRLGAQYESVTRDLSTPDSEDRAVILEASYSLSNEVTLRMDYRLELDNSMGEENDAVYFTFIYYGL